MSIDAIASAYCEGRILQPLRRRRSSLRHVFCQGGLPDIDAKFSSSHSSAAHPIAGWRRSSRESGCELQARPLVGHHVAVTSSANRLGSRHDATDHRCRVEDFQCVQHLRCQATETDNASRSKLLKTSRLGDLRRSTLSWCRRMRISACSATRDRNRPPTRHQINLERSPIAETITRFAADSQRLWVCGRDNGSVLSLIAFYATPGHRATWFALMASLMT